MGNQGSSQNDKSVLESNQSSKVLKIQNNDSNMGVSDKETTAETLSSKEFKETKIPTFFEWKENGNVVYLVGSFGNWSQLFAMKKIDNERFELTLDLPRGIYQYKFVVDNVWKFSKHHKICNDGRGNINNIIDNNEDSEKINPNKFHNGSKEYIENPYPSNFPFRRELHIDADKVPDGHRDKFDLINLSNQYIIGNHEFINTINKEYNNVNTSFHSLPVPPHININHLNTNIDSNDRVLITSTFQKVRNKYVTMIYYKPIN